MKGVGNSSGRARPAGGTRPRSRSSVCQPVAQIPALSLNVSACYTTTTKANEKDEMILIPDQN